MRIRRKINTKNIEKIKIVFLMIILSIASVLLASCDLINTSSGQVNKNKDYYQGTQGVVTTFESGTPPSKLYYYRDQENKFEINLEIQNKGASFTRGGVFISGYDPNMIYVKGIELTKDNNWRAECKFKIGNIGFGDFGGMLDCKNVQVGVGKDQGEVSLDNLDVGGALDKIFSTDFFKDNDLFRDMRADFQYNNGAFKFQADFNDPNIQLEYANHGRLLVALFSAISFERNFGREYMLQGNTYEYPGGELTLETFEGQVTNWPEGLDEIVQPFQVTNCYLYTTYASPNVCIDPNPMSEDKKVCYPKSYTWSNSQGAPVSITKIEQENTPYQVFFTIYIKNVGNGRVYDLQSAEMCSPYYPDTVTSTDLDVVYLGDIRIGRQRLKCTPNDYVRLQNGQGIVTCIYDIDYQDIRSAYETPLVAELWYAYSETIIKRVTFKRAG